MKILGIVLVTLAIATCAILGTLGWFAVGFGVMSDCTNTYSCSETGCPPCATTERWITAGGLLQWVLGAASVTLLVAGPRSRWRAWLPLGGVVLITLSVLTVVGTTWRAQESFCRPGTDGYADSYCGVDD